jgi:hypothetical protein
MLSIALTALKYWKPIAVGLAIFGLVVFYNIKIHEAREDGRRQLRAEQVSDFLKKNKDATDADDASRKCSLDPACRMQSDGFRRD